MGTNCNICSDKCFGVPDHHGSCCTIEDRDFIIGPHTDSFDFVDRLSGKLGREIEYSDVFINYEEGKNMFPDKPTWQTPNSYPALRVDLLSFRRPCIFYNTKVRACMVYDIRPNTCKEYECEYLTKNS